MCGWVRANLASNLSLRAMRARDAAMAQQSRTDDQPAAGVPMIAHRLTGSRCRCSGCGDYFNSVSVFDRHRVGGWQGRTTDRRCLNASEMRARGWVLNARGFWIERQRVPERIDRARYGGAAQQAGTPAGVQP